jgi:uncharacterized protein
VKEKGLRVIIIVLVLFMLGQSSSKKFVVKQYEITSTKVNTDIRIVFISDLHSCYYGEGQMELLKSIDEQKPDLVLLGGDIVDDRFEHFPSENAYVLLEAIGKKYPCYYVSGNHEVMSKDMANIKEAIRTYSIDVLEGNSKQIEIRGQLVTLGGVDDPTIGVSKYKNQLANAVGKNKKEHLNLLLAHRPEKIAAYLNYNVDIVFSGHAHGGQWRIPGILNGLYAPNQGFFPKYAGGKYDHENAVHIVSRGLARESTHIPRLFNTPELVVVDIKPI